MKPSPQSTAMPADLGLTWQSITKDDLDAWFALEQAIEAADDLEERYSRDDLHDELFAGSWKDPSHDTLIGFDPDGVARAFALVETPPGDVRTARGICWGGIHPDWRRRGIGRAVLAWSQARAIAKLSENGKGIPRRLLAHSDGGLVDRERLLASAGFAPARWFVGMSRVLSGTSAAPLPEVPVGDELRITPYDPALDEAVRHAHNEAFADHWGSEPRSAESWQQLTTTGSRNFRPGWSFVALAGDEVVAYTISSAYEQEWAARGYRMGWTDLVGVCPAWRGRRVAPALVVAAMGSFAADGMERAGLGVDTENATGALALYERLGYRAEKRSTTWALDL